LAIVEWIRAGGLQALTPEQVSAKVDQITLLGHSRGGMAAMIASDSSPQLFNSVLLLDPVDGNQTATTALRIHRRSRNSAPVAIVGCGRKITERGNYKAFVEKLKADDMNLILFELHNAGHLDFCDEENPSCFLRTAKLFVEADPDEASREETRSLTTSMFAAQLRSSIYKDSDGLDRLVADVRAGRVRNCTVSIHNPTAVPVLAVKR